MSFKLLVFGTGRYLLAEPEIDGRRQSSISHVGSMNTRCIQLHSRVVNISPLADLCSLTSRNFTFRRTSDITSYSLKFPPRKYSITSPDNPNFQLFAFNTIWLLIEPVSEFSFAQRQSMPPKSDLALLSEKDQFFLVECIKNAKEKFAPDFEGVAQATDMSKKGAS